MRTSNVLNYLNYCDFAGSKPGETRVISIAWFGMWFLSMSHVVHFKRKKCSNFYSVAKLENLILKLLYNWVVVSTRLLASILSILGLLGFVIFGSYYSSSCFSFLVFFFYTSCVFGWYTFAFPLNLALLKRREKNKLAAVMRWLM